MGKVTYQTLVPTSFVPFCEEMAALYSEIEHDLYRDMQQREDINDLKREYQHRYQINARQFNAINIELQGKISSREECHKQQLKDIRYRIYGLENKIESLKKRLEKTWESCPVGRRRSGYRKHLKFQIHHKQRKLASLQAKLKRLQNKKPSLIFGSRKLWEAQFNLEANGYSSHSQWLKDWRAARANQFSFVGSGDETAGCQICQLSIDGTMLIKVPPKYEGKFGEYIHAKRGTYVRVYNIKFPYGQEDIYYALAQGQAMTYRFVRKDNQWYLFATTSRPKIPIQTNKENGCLGIDLNPSVIGWSYCDSEGNLKAFGQININLQDRSTKQTEAILGDAVKQLVDIATTHNCPISVEDLDFSLKKASMKQQGVRYSRMLSNFSYSKFYELLSSRTKRYGVELINVNPAFSSQVGLAKFMSLYGMSSDTAAALVLARRALGHSERLPAKYARFGAVQKKRHVWSNWRALGTAVKKASLKLNRWIRRHDYFAKRTTDSRVVVILLEAQSSKGKSKSKRKFKTKTLPLAGVTPASESLTALFGRRV